jgi:hypothetical protein
MIPAADPADPIANFAQGSRTGLVIEAEKLNSLIEKWVRGIYYKIHGHPLSRDGEISVIHIDASEVSAAFWSILGTAKNA